MPAPDQMPLEAVSVAPIPGKPSIDGSSRGGGCPRASSAANASTLPKRTPATGWAVRSSAVSICETDAYGACDRSSATIPATTGVEPDVPQPTPKPPPSNVVGMQAGAANLTQSPRLE